MWLRQQIPNSLTCGNLLMGCAGIVAISRGWPIEIAYFVWAACAFDFFDGFAARALKVTSPIGKELDSLADMVSFGVLPAMMMFDLISKVSDDSWFAWSAFLIAVFSAVRLAIFNTDSRQAEGFIGLPTPANAMLITGLPLLPAIMDFEWNSYLLVAIVFVSSWLMVSPIELLALKFKHFRWKENELRFTLLVVSVLLLVFLGPPAIVLVIITYVILSLFGRRWDAGAVSSSK